MKKALVLIVLVIGLVSMNPAAIGKDAPYTPPAGSREELYQDTFITLLDPCIEKAIENYYGRPFAYDPWSVRILNIERPNGDRTTYFIIKLQVMPYIGAHNPVGIDNLTISVASGQGAKVEKFEHVKSYEIPPWLR